VRDAGLTIHAVHGRAALEDALVADGPDPEHADALMLFGRLVGEWEFDWTGYDEDGAETMSERGEWIFAWVLEGRGVQDVWIIPARERRGDPDLPRGEYGTTIRFYDPKLDAWQVTWHGPVQGVRRLFLGRAIGDEIVQEGQTEEGYPMRWIFSEITDTSFRWRSVYSRDEEQTWQLREEMHVLRAAEAE
jgi:hypothetical protein